ncbi:MAG: MaoC/PaaZ C-terminal domain-containing protein [Alphaproteobacteria bacterium]|nr:MaoC/PaaZ C-terminal domain-containing protein [Alphaproteobacteria bacterium]
MAIDYDVLMAWPFPDVEQTYTEKDTILYALGVGLGADALDHGQLRYVYEEGLAALPSMAVVLGYPGMWLRDPGIGIDWVKVLHGEQGFEIHQPLPAEGTVVGRTKVTGIVDKGAGKGALIYTERTIHDRANGVQLASLTSTTFCRGDGGFGGPDGPSKPPHSLPEGKPDEICDLPTIEQAALIYRLSGDTNPIHVDPQIAKAAGFDRPVLHGLCTLGVASHAILKVCCGYEPSRLKSLRLRFSAPVYPGETIRTELWRDGNAVSFRSRVVERDAVVLNNGYAELSS